MSAILLACVGAAYILYVAIIRPLFKMTGVI